MLILSIAFLVLTLVPGIGIEKNYARRWLAIPGVGIRFQPSELAKWVTIFFVAAYCDKFGDEIGLFKKRFLPVVMLIGFVAGLIIIEDFGTAAFVSLLCFMILIIAIGSVFIYFGYSARNTKFVISEQGLRIKGCLYGRIIPRDSLAAQGAQILDLIHDKTHSPKIRRNGVGLPGYLEGWFKLKSGEKALLFLTNKKQAVYIPTNNSFSMVIINPQNES